MREVIIVAWCDACAADGVRAEGVAMTEALDGSPVEIDLCEAHAEPLRAARQLLQTLGRPTKPAKGAKARKARRGEPEVYACPDCDLTSTTPQGLGAHRAKKHGYVSSSPGATARRRATARRDVA